jgi:hypothetical protein
MAVNTKMLLDLLDKAILPDECNCYTCRVERLNNLMHAVMKAQWPNDPVPAMCDIKIHGGHELFPTWCDQVPERYKKIIGWMEKIDHQHTEALKVLSRSTLEVCSCCGMYNHKSAIVRFIDRNTEEVTSICPSCTKYYSICACCQKGGLRGQFSSRLINTSSGAICNDCYQKHYYQCVVCGQRHKRDGKETNWTELSGDRRRNETVYWICPNCLDKEATKCEVCNSWMLRGNAYRLDRGGPVMCHDCYTLQANDIQNFDYKPRKFNKLVGKFEKTPPRDDALLFGVELEMEPRDTSEWDRGEMARIMLKLCGRDRFFVKHDGTVRSGIELVSNPFSWQWLKENKTHMESIFKEVARRKYSATHTGNAGFHVHMTKKAFGTFHLYKFIQFYYKPSVQSFVKLISERTHNWRYASFRTEDCGAATKRVAKMKLNMEPSRSTRLTESTVQHMRHSAISLMYEPTVEVRIFAGVDTMSRFMKNMEFIKSTYDFTKDAKLSDLIVSKYIHFIMERRNRNKYPTLIKFLANSPEMKEYFTQSYNYINRNL